MSKESEQGREEFRREAKETFGANLGRLRQKSGLSQEALSLRASLIRTHVGRMEKCDLLPELDTVYRLAGALGVDPAELTAGIFWRPDRSEAGGHGTDLPPDQWSDT